MAKPFFSRPNWRWSRETTFCTLEWLVKSSYSFFIALRISFSATSFVYCWVALIKQFTAFLHCGCAPMGGGDSVHLTCWGLHDYIDRWTCTLMVKEKVLVLRTFFKWNSESTQTNSSFKSKRRYIVHSRLNIRHFYHWLIKLLMIIEVCT